MFVALKKFALAPPLSATLLAAVCFCSPLAHSQSSLDVLAAAGVQKPVIAEAITVKLEAFKVERGAKGKESFVAADMAKPGDIIEYRAVYTNISDKPVQDVKALLPIPTGARYLGNTAKPQQVMARTAEQKDFAPVPLKKSIADIEGDMQEIGIPYAEYRELHWNLGTLKPASSKSVSARVAVRTRSDKSPQPTADIK